MRHPYLIALLSLAALALAQPTDAAAKCYKVHAGKTAIYECRASANSFPGVIRDALQFRFQGATVSTEEDDKCPAKLPACEDEKASEAAAKQQQAGVRRHEGNLADSQNACNDKLNAPTECARGRGRHGSSESTALASQADPGDSRRARYYRRYYRPYDSP